MKTKLNFVLQRHWCFIAMSFVLDRSFFGVPAFLKNIHNMNYSTMNRNDSIKDISIIIQYIIMTPGKAVDDTIHFLYEYIKLRQKGQDRDEAPNRVTMKKSQAIPTSSVTPGIGFGVMVFLKFTPMLISASYVP